MAVELMSGLDALDLAERTKKASLARRFWSASWPKLMAIAIVVALWQILVIVEWKPSYVLPPPAEVLTELKTRLGTDTFWNGVATTAGRAGLGFGFSVVFGGLLGLAVARIKILRAAIGSMITALQTMPSIAWFPLAILFFQLSEQAIFFVVVLGAAPSIANGVISGVDYVPPLLLRAGRNLGARGFKLYWHVIAPAALPAIIAGLKQGWAFAWRSLMAGELIVLGIGSSIGAQLTLAREFSDAHGVIAMMMVIFVIGLGVDFVFTLADKTIRRRWGVLDQAA